MTPFEFNSLNLQVGDIIDVISEDGSKNRYLLYHALATTEVPERVKYLTGEKVPIIPSKIIVQDQKTGNDLGLALATIKNIEWVRYYV